MRSSGLTGSAPSRAAAELQLEDNQAAGPGYLTLARVAWYEAIAVGPLLLLLVVLFSVRAIVYGVTTLLAVLAVLLGRDRRWVVLLAILYLPVAWLRYRRRIARAPQLGSPAVGQRHAMPQLPFQVQSLDEAIREASKARMVPSC